MVRSVEQCPADEQALGEREALWQLRFSLKKWREV